MCYTGQCKYEKDNGKNNWCILPINEICPMDIETETNTEDHETNND